MPGCRFPRNETEPNSWTCGRKSVSRDVRVENMCARDLGLRNVDVPQSTMGIYVGKQTYSYSPTVSRWSFVQILVKTGKMKLYFRSSSPHEEVFSNVIQSINFSQNKISCSCMRG